jgi:hypothetical protein
MYWEVGSTEIFWSSISTMMNTIADAYETGAYYLDNDCFEVDNRKLLEVMWRNDPNMINSIIKQLEIVKKDRLNHLPSKYNISRFVWHDISKLFETIRLTSDNSIRSELLQEFTSIFLEECEQIINRAV